MPTAKPPLTKSQLATEIARRLHNDVPHVAAHRMLDALEAIVQEELRRGRPVTLPGVAKLYVREVPRRAARQGINPATGEPLRIPAKPAHRTVKARLLKATRQAVGRRG